MKKLSLLLLILLSTLSCSQTKNDIKKEITMSDNIPVIPRNKQITYGIEVTLFYPYEIYINNIKADFSPNGGNAAIEINPYVLKNGKYKIKLKLFPYTNQKSLSPKEIEDNTLQFSKVIKKIGGIGVEEREHLSNLPITLPKEPAGYFEQEWEVELTELPYELEGWSKGQDLTKLDRKQLEAKVVKYYQKLWSILNEGKGNEFQKLWKIADKESFSFDYISLDDYNQIITEDKEMIEQKCKGNMIPLEDYEMKLYAQGRLVTLERKSHTQSFNNEERIDIYSWSPLIRKYKISGGEDYPVKLYLPQGSNEFVILRK